MTLSPEVRGVFDRMLATREEIEQAARRSGYRDAGDPRHASALRNFRAEAEEDLLAARLRQEEEAEEAALQALHGQAALRYLEAEIAALEPDYGTATAVFLPDAADSAAEIAKGWTAREMDEDIYLAAQAQAGQRAALAEAEGDGVEALRQRRRQLLNHHLWLEARKKRQLLLQIQNTLRPVKDLLAPRSGDAGPSPEEAVRSP